MPTFRYTALTASGASVSGRFDVATAELAVHQLQRQGLLPISTVEDRPVRSRLGLRRPRSVLPGRDLVLLSRQLARLLQAGLPLDRALALLGGLIRGRAGRQAIKATLDRVRDGASLTDAMAAQEVFPKVFLAMVRAGERGAALPGVLDRLADFLGRMQAVRDSVVSALIYPAVLAVVAAGSVGLVLTVVLPQFEPLFQEAGDKLPWITRAVMTVGDGVSATWWVAAPVALAMALLWRAAMRQALFARERDRLLLRLPLLGSLIIRFDAARFARTLGALLTNGVAVAHALPLASEAVGNRVLSGGLREAATRLREGQGLAEPLRQIGRFPDLLVQLVRVGEETGRLGELLDETANVLDAEAQRIVERLLALLVPGLTIAMGAAIAVIVAAVLLAMMSINDLAG